MFGQAGSPSSRDFMAEARKRPTWSQSQVCLALPQRTGILLAQSRESKGPLTRCKDAPQPSLSVYKLKHRHAASSECPTAWHRPKNNSELYSDQANLGLRLSFLLLSKGIKYKKHLRGLYKIEESRNAGGNHFWNRSREVFFSNSCPWPGMVATVVCGITSKDRRQG